MLGRLYHAWVPKLKHESWHESIARGSFWSSISVCKLLIRLIRTNNHLIMHTIRDGQLRSCVVAIFYGQLRSCEITIIQQLFILLYSKCTSWLKKSSEMYSFSTFFFIPNNDEEEKKRGKKNTFREIF